jgi:hypothetical protein
MIADFYPLTLRIVKAHFIIYIQPSKNPKLDNIHQLFLFLHWLLLRLEAV